MARELIPAAFVAKWSSVELSERAASHEHFLDLCRLLGQPTPAEHDATGALRMNTSARDSVSLNSR